MKCFKEFGLAIIVARTWHVLARISRFLDN